MDLFPSAAGLSNLDDRHFQSRGGGESGAEDPEVIAWPPALQNKTGKRAANGSTIKITSDLAYRSPIDRTTAKTLKVVISLRSFSPTSDRLEIRPSNCA